MCIGILKNTPQIPLNPGVGYQSLSFGEKNMKKGKRKGRKMAYKKKGTEKIKKNFSEKGRINEK